MADDRRPDANEERSERGWDAARVQQLRGHIAATQDQLASRLGTRQQTVSEWEVGNSTPRRMSRRLLHLVAEESGFYDVEAAGSDDTDSEVAS
ncbi:MAG TPA: hypothetical protein QF624_02530 [Dehalococcoidia bacterium]|nr:hypothetical protein [Dehalococcoidia bacterium]